MKIGKKIAVGIVLYNPVIERWIQCLNAVELQCDKIYLVDNNSKNISEILQIVETHRSCTLVQNDHNKGIAAALNQIMEAAETDGFDWVLTLDDDSVCNSDLVEKLWEATENPYVGIICPVAIDDKIGRFEDKNVEAKFQEIQDCITAGSLTNVIAWRKCGGFDEQMFIDFVDIEYCTRLRENGYKIIQARDTCVHQQYGNVTSTVSFWGHHFSIFNYSPVRIYYSVRNQIYYMRKHKGSVNMFKQIAFLFGYIGKRIVFEKNKMKSIKAVVKGIKDGRKMQY